MTTWFTADLHIGHARIIEFCGRPFGSIEEHDAALIGEWRAKVAPEDTVYFLGDLTLNPRVEDVIGLLRQLPGQIRVVPGNHDRALKRFAKGRAAGALGSLGDLNRVAFLRGQERAEGFPRVRLDGKTLLLNHHPIEDWPGRSGRPGRRDEDPLAGRWHLHGHSHGKSAPILGRLDVGWDTARSMLCWDQVQSMIRTAALEAAAR